MQERKLVIFAWSGDLDRVWPQLILATSGAAMGMRTTVFFTFWGLFPLVRNDVRITAENWMQKMMAVINLGAARGPGRRDPVHLTEGSEMPSMEILYAKGDRFLVDVRGHDLVIGQPAAAGGDDVGPTPTELLVASLATCVGFHAERFLPA